MFALFLVDAVALIANGQGDAMLVALGVWAGAAAGGWVGMRPCGDAAEVYKRYIYDILIF